MTTPHRRILVTGSRTWTDTAVIRAALATVWHPKTVLVSGARGGEVNPAMILNACTEGCYKHYDKATGSWKCYKCGT
jgi:hypothetical protein